MLTNMLDAASTILSSTASGPRLLATIVAAPPRTIDHRILHRPAPQTVVGSGLFPGFDVTEHSDQEGAQRLRARRDLLARLDPIALTEDIVAAFIDGTGGYRGMSSAALEDVRRPNSLDLRLRRVQQLTGTDLRSVRDIVRLWLALRARQSELAS
jgi:hypothetical protein